MLNNFDNSPLFAISPIDGRYSEHTNSLREYFSEFALIRRRCEIELDYLLAFDDLKIFKPLTSSERERILTLRVNFDEKCAKRVKEIEATTRHDVKACEYFIRETLNIEEPNRIHFALTSEDVNNLSWTTLIRDYRDTVQLPQLRSIIQALTERVNEGRSSVFPTRTHGQFASPSTAGKEIAVYLSRFCNWAETLTSHRFRGKLNGATGTFAAHMSAAPNIDWISFARRFVESQRLDFNFFTTQIEDHDAWAHYFNITKQILNVIIDFDQDMWLYLMQGFYCEKTVAGEIGSSTMPHKVNPIRFENSEGNAQFAVAQLGFLADKLTRSRMQRDLSDSTVARNIGVALAHGHLSISETLSGLTRISLNKDACAKIASEHPEVLAEPVQTILRRFGAENPYESLKNLTRGRNDFGQCFVKSNIGSFANAVPQVSREECAKLLMELSPETYVGAAARICDEALTRALRWTRKEPL
jgi:adenylosuccinate lyase